MNRRGFFASLAAFVAVPFVPKPKPSMVSLSGCRAQTITLPPPNHGVTWTITTNASAGNALYVRMPQRFVVSDGLAYQPQHLVNTVVEVTEFIS